MVSNVRYSTLPMWHYQPKRISPPRVFVAHNQPAHSPSSVQAVGMAAAFTLAAGIAATIYRKQLRFMLTHLFQKDVLLPNIPAFSVHGLQPSVATAKDIPEIAKLSMRFFIEATQHELDEMLSSLRRRSDVELKQYFKSMSRHGNVDADATFSTFKKMMQQDPESLKHLLKQDGDMEIQERLLRSRFIDNPKGALIVLKDRKGKIVAMEGINQFQPTYDLHMDQGMFDAIDPKHGVVSLLYVRPGYRRRGIATALKQEIIQYGRERLGYRYIWSVTKGYNSSHHINQRLGYKPLTAKTRFPDSPAFTPERIQQLLREYNIGSHQLTWLNSRAI